MDRGETCPASTAQYRSRRSGLWAGPPYHPGVQGYQRKQLLERIDRDGATIGTRIPERVSVCGEPVDLRAFVFEIKRLESIPPGERARVDRAKKNLRRERRRRRQRIESADIEYAEGERLAETVIGIDRALDALRTLGSADLEGAADDQAAADQRRWLSFLRQVLGHDERGRRSRP